MTVLQRHSDPAKFNPSALLPFGLRTADFAGAMQDIYDFLFDVNSHLTGKDLQRLDDMLRPANLSGMLSDMLTVSLSKHSRSLVVNAHHNGHPDLIVRGRHPGNAVKAGDQGVEIKSTRKPGGAVDTHGGRDQWMCVFVYSVDNETEPEVARRSLSFTEVYIGQVVVADFRRNERGELGTRTSTLHAEGIAKLRQNWVYLDPVPSTRIAAKRGKAAAARSK